MNRFIRPLGFVAAVLLSTTAMAQWQWLDKDGHKVFSDRAPPPGIPDKNILKRPGGLKAAASQANQDGTEPDVAPAQAASAAPKVSGVDKDLVDKKKKADQEEAAKRKAEEDKLAKTRADNCARAKQAKASYDSGVRLARVNPQGEREILDDATRSAESQRVQAIIASDCK